MNVVTSQYVVCQFCGKESWSRQCVECERKLRGDLATTEASLCLATTRDIKLRDAVRRAGFAVMETSGDWSIHEVTDRAKEQEETELAAATLIAELEAEVELLKRQLRTSEQDSRRTRIAELTSYAKEREAAGADTGPQWEEIRRLQKIVD